MPRRGPKLAYQEARPYLTQEWKRGIALRSMAGIALRPTAFELVLMTLEARVHYNFHPGLSYKKLNDLFLEYGRENAYKRARLFNLTLKLVCRWVSSCTNAKPSRVVDLMKPLYPFRS